jgi:ABC-type transport system substrate-binding protein
MKRLSHLLTAVLAAGAFMAAAAQPQKVLRYAFLTAETGFDPARINDLYSRIITPHIFESPYTYDHLARPYKLKPRTAAGMPEVSADYRVWTVRIQPGIYFTDDPAFKGRRRELVAADYVYSFKRLFDPAVKSPWYSTMKEEGLLGLEELRQQALKGNRPFDYDREIEGVRALDRYTVQFKLGGPRPRFVYVLAASDIYGAVAREVVEFYGENIMEHPVGTGPFTLKQWRRSSFIALERNPGYREHRYDAEPNADDAEGQALAAKFKGRRLPMVDRVEISIIEESQPRWLAFLDKQHDFLDRVPLEFSSIAVPNGKLAPNLAKQGITMARGVASDSTMTLFNMDDPVVGGYTPEKVALRRAIGLGYDTDREIRLVRRGQAVPAQSPVPPHTYGYDPEYRSENSQYDLAKARALLDMYGYVDRDGDGWRELPDGAPLTVELMSPTDQVYRQLNEVRKKAFDALGLRLTIRFGQWPELLKSARAGKYMTWTVGLSASSPDGQLALEASYGPATGGQNLSRFRLEAFDRLYERMKALPDGPERQALFAEANKLVVAYLPYKYHVHRVLTDLSQPWLSGYRRPLFWTEFWQYVDIDTELRDKTLQ